MFVKWEIRTFMSKILFIIPALNAGGAERVMVTLANEWSKKGNDITIVIFHKTGCFYELSDNVKLVEMGLSLPTKGITRVLSIPSIEYKRYRYIYELAKREQYDYLISFTNVTNIFACLMSKKLRDSYVVISERADPKDYSPYMQFAIKKLYGKCDMVICQNSVVEHYFESLGFKNKLPVLPNPVNFTDIPTIKSTERGHVISAVGRLTNQKNHKLLIDAFSEVHKDHPEYTLRIYGVGPLETELRARIEELGLSKSIELMGTKKRVMFEIDKTEIFVLCSDFEGFPNVLIEAMATQMPVIASDFATGVARELITDGINGYLFDVGDKQGLIDALNNMIGRRNEFDGIGRFNRDIAMRYKDDVIAQQWLNVIDEAFNEKRSRNFRGVKA